MAEFIYRDYSTELKFGNYSFELPLNEQTAELMDRVLYKRMVELKPQGVEEINEGYNSLLDGIDEIFGEGAADKMLEGFKHPGLLEVSGVIKFIVEEYRDKYTAAVEEMKKTAPEVAPANRAQRRARR